MEKQFLLAGDIGGTKTILALFSHERGPLQPHFEASYQSNDFPGLDAIITEFLSQTDISAAVACFGVAGPVRDGRAIITKLPWQPDTRMLQDAHDFDRVTLINDLVATGYAIPHLIPSDYYAINKGFITAEGSLGIIAPGTGLGEALFAWEGERYIGVASEGGHSDFAPQTETEIDLLKFLKNRYGHVSYDRICSGQGLPDIYDFLKETCKLKEPAWLKEELAVVDDRTPVIVNGALDNSRECAICDKTLQMFVAILGAEAGNLALNGLTTGGIFLGGGISPRILPFLQQKTFLASFCQKGRMSYLLNDIPVKVILNSRAALIGAASFGLGLKFAALK
jgi:glucokinase